MKKRYFTLVSITMVVVTHMACTKDQLVTIPPTNQLVAPKIALIRPPSDTTYTFTQANTATDSIAFVITQANYKVSVATNNTIQIDKKGNNFKNAANVLVVGNTADTPITTSVAYAAINGAMLSQLKFFNTEASQLELRVATTIVSNAPLVGIQPDTLYSNAIPLTITPYVDLVVIQGTGADVPPVLYPSGNNVYTGTFEEATASTGVYFSYKNTNYTDDGSGTNIGGTLVGTGGSNIALEARGYIVTVDLTKTTYTITRWGVVGDATPNAWGGPDVPMHYDDATGTWMAIFTAAPGSCKFRQNDDWPVNYGSGGSDGTNDGTLKNGGGNITSIAAAGTYKAVADFKKLTYTLTKQ